MLPVKLKLQAFASYVEAAEIDFERLDRLFLIHGETGAGKTAVLDAVTYALYGESSGGDRTDMRCVLPAAEKLPTLVEFTFKIRGGLYKFTRTVTVTPRSKKLEQKQDCFYFDASSGCFRSFFDNPKQSSVRAKAEELTGLSAEQFRQVIILPQGKFEQLLTSASRDKEDILSTLFGADKYTRLSDKLWEKSEALRKRLDGEARALDSMLAAEKIESREQLEPELERLRTEADALSPQLEEARRELSESRGRLTAAELLAAKFSELEAAEKRLAELDLSREDTESRRLLLKRHENASRALGERNAFASAEKNFADRENLLALAEKSLSSAEKGLAEAEKVKAAFSEREAENKVKSEKLAVLISLAPLYEKISRKIEELNRLSAQAELCAKRFGAAEKKALDCDKAVSELREKREYIEHNFSRRLPELAARLEDLKRGAEAEKRLAAYSAALEKIREKIALLNGGADRLEAERAAAEKRYDKLYGDYIRNAAAELSSRLKEGMPCPVCGSLSHPAPAEASESSATAAEVKAARAVFEKLSAELANMRTEIAREEARIPAAEDCIASERRIVSDTRYTPEELEAVLPEYGKAAAENGKLPETDRRLNELSALRTELESLLAAEARELEAARNAEYGAKAEISAIRESLDPEFGDETAYAAEVRRLKADTEAFVREKEQADSSRSAAERLRIQAAAAAEQARNECGSARSARDSAKAAFMEKLSVLGIAPEEYGGLLLTEENAARLSDGIKEYDLAMHAARERAGTLKKELADKARPQLEELKAAAENAENILSELSGRQALAEERLVRLQKLSEEYSDRFAVLLAERESSDKLSAFAGFMRGDRGISFTRYFLGMMLSLVTDEANRILADVSGGRFRLRVKSGGGANSKQGLDLEAETLTADFKAAYGVKNLSGGEKFLISLALSLGLSAVAQSRSGGIGVEAMFIDEGFGSLDPASLKEAVSVLCGLAAGRSSIGIISHVEELKNVIPCGIRIKKNAAGASFVTV